MSMRSKRIEKELFELFKEVWLKHHDEPFCKKTIKELTPYNKAVLERLADWHLEKLDSQ